jgi:hypothetical protein
MELNFSQAQLRSTPIFLHCHRKNICLDTDLLALSLKRTFAVKVDTNFLSLSLKKHSENIRSYHQNRSFRIAHVMTNMIHLPGTSKMDCASTVPFSVQKEYLFRLAILTCRPRVNKCRNSNTLINFLVSRTVRSF